jgi:hypothetical protein
MKYVAETAVRAFGLFQNTTLRGAEMACRALLLQAHAIMQHGPVALVERLAHAQVKTDLVVQSAHRADRPVGAILLKAHQTLGSLIAKATRLTSIMLTTNTILLNRALRIFEQQTMTFAAFRSLRAVGTIIILIGNAFAILAFAAFLANVLAALAIMEYQMLTLRKCDTRTQLGLLRPWRLPIRAFRCQTSICLAAIKPSWALNVQIAFLAHAIL